MLVPKVTKTFSSTPEEKININKISIFLTKKIKFGRLRKNNGMKHKYREKNGNTSSVEKHQLNNCLEEKKKYILHLRNH